MSVCVGWWGCGVCVCVCVCECVYVCVSVCVYFVSREVKLVNLCHGEA